MTKDQIAYLFKFCEKHLVYFYEVQLELVDHLANAIEEEMKANPRLTFKNALDVVYSRFGVMGFSTVVREKSRQLERRARKQYWQLIKEQFHWPQILRGLFSGAVAYTAFSIHPLAGLILIVVVLLAGSVINIFLARRFNQLIKKSGKRFLMADYSFGANFGFVSLYFLAQVIIYSWEFQPLTGGLILAIFVILMSASNQLCIKYRDKLISDFPEVFHFAR